MDDLMDLNVMELATTKLVSVEADYDIDEALSMRKDVDEYEYQISRMLGRSIYTIN